MSYTLLLHLHNEDPVVGEVDELPHPGDNFVIVTNMRRKDGKDLTNIESNATSLIYPWHRIVFIEIMAAEEEGAVIGFIRE